MSTPSFPPSQLFKILSVAYPKQAADLINANPKGPIDGYHLNNDSNNQSWSITAFEDETQSKTTPKITTFSIKNEATQTYASVRGEFEGAELFGSSTPYPWVIDTIKNGHTIATKNKLLCWALQSGQDYTTIVVLPIDCEYIKRAEFEWTFECVKREEDEQQ